MTTLDKIIAHKKIEVEQNRRSIPLTELQAGPFPGRRDFTAALGKKSLSVIAEIKRRSPSAGAINRRADPVYVARQYESGGARAISVLTDQRFFGGTVADLVNTKRAVRLPVMRKDFIVDEYQIFESRRFGADAILLIARILEDRALTRFIALAEDVGMACLVEVRTRREVEKALAAGAQIIGINNRDLRTMRVDLAVSLELKRLIPADRITVSESGISSRRDFILLADAGFDAVLVGEALMKSRNPVQKLRELRYD
jgi:indole-3-glycerol phosphate synthase